MIELYSMRDVAEILALKESQLRYWMQVGLVGATVRKGGRFYYTFADLVAVKTTRDLLAGGVSPAKVRKNVEALRKSIPLDANPTTRLRICSDGETLVALDEDVPYVPTTGQVVMAFLVPSLAARIAEVMPLPMAVAAANDEQSAIPEEIGGEPTEATANTVAWDQFVAACSAEDDGDMTRAEALYRYVIELEPSLAAAHTNLGSLLFASGRLAEARKHYEQALDCDPNQPEARYNLANILDDEGHGELAIAELRRVCAMAPTFADAHFNLGVLLAKQGGLAQAKTHMKQYLEIDGASEWADRAHAFLRDLDGGHLPTAVARLA